MANKKQRGVYSNAFKVEVVTAYETSSLTMREVAKQYGISNGMLSKWKRNISVTEEIETPSDEVLELRSEVSKMRSEIQSLKDIVCKQIVEKHNWLFDDLSQ